MKKQVLDVVEIKSEGINITFYDKTFRTGYLVSVSDDAEWIKKNINSYLLEYHRNGADVVNHIWEDWRDFGNGYMGVTWPFDNEFLIVIGVHAKVEDKLYDTQQTVLHELIHGVYRSLDFNGVSHNVDIHEHFVLYYDRLCLEVIPAFWEWANNDFKARREDE